MTFIKHPEENNKDHKAVQHVLTNTNHLITKIYQRQHRCQESSKTVYNERIEQTFNFLVEEIKSIHSKLPKKEDRVIIEVKSLNWQCLHYIITNSMYLFLELDGKRNYRIEYKFHNSPFETQLRGWIDRLAMNSYTTESVEVRDFDEFYRRMLRTKPESNIFLL